jgi:uncharacterized protein (TIGR04255 family)
MNTLTVPQKYPKPPAVEAILQFRYGTPFDNGALKRIPRLLKSGYPNAKPERDFQLNIEMNPTENQVRNTQANVVDEGVRLTSTNDDRTIIVRKRSIAFAWLAPYPGWDAYFPAACEVFETVREKTGVRQVISIGLRYINRIDIPTAAGTSIFPSHYLNFGAGLPSIDVFRALNAIDLGVEMALKRDGVVARMNAATAAPVLIDHVSLLLDIDIIASLISPKVDDQWSLVADMRDYKNQIFEACITDKSRELFGWKHE